MSAPAAPAQSTRTPRSEPMFRTLQTAIFNAERAVAKAEKKAVAAYEEDPHAREALDLADELRVAQVTLDALKAAFEAEKARQITSITPAPPAEDGKVHPTPEMVWQMAAYANTPCEGFPAQPFPPLQELEILDREAMKAVPWLNAILQAFKHPKGDGTAYCSINNCLSYTYTEVTEDGKMLNGTELVDIAVLNKTTGDVEVWTIYPEGEAHEAFCPGEIHITYEASETSHLTGWFYSVWRGHVHKLDCETFHRM